MSRAHIIGTPGANVVDLIVEQRLRDGNSKYNSAEHNNIQHSNTPNNVKHNSVGYTSTKPNMRGKLCVPKINTPIAVLGILIYMAIVATNRETMTDGTSGLYWFGEPVFMAITLLTAKYWRDAYNGNPKTQTPPRASNTSAALTYGFALMLFMAAASTNYNDSGAMLQHMHPGLWITQRIVALVVGIWLIVAVLHNITMQRTARRQLAYAQATDPYRQAARQAAQDRANIPTVNVRPDGTIIDSDDIYNANIGSADRAAVHKRAAKQFDAVVTNNTDIKAAGFTGAEVPIVLGALGEVRTSKILAETLPRALGSDVTIINDMSILDNTGRERADIDHLVLTHRGHVTVDSKVWSDAPTFVSNGRGYSLDPSGKHWQIVSTCLWEASQLPAPPAAILIAVSGKALRDQQMTHLMTKHHGMIPITAYTDRYKRTTAQCPVPVYIVEQKNLATTVTRALTQLQRTKTRTPALTVTMLRRTKQLVIPK